MGRQPWSLAITDVPPGIVEDELRELARRSEKVIYALDGTGALKVIRPHTATGQRGPSAVRNATTLVSAFQGAGWKVEQQRDGR